MASPTGPSSLISTEFLSSYSSFRPRNSRSGKKGIGLGMRREDAERQSSVSTLHLHPQFVEELRVLFDIVDTQRTGRVPYEVLCSRFGELPHPPLPRNFLQCLGRVTPADGHLSFERFLAAVNLSFREANVPAQTIYRVQSEGRLNVHEPTTAEKRRLVKNPAMGVNGFGSKVGGVYSSQPVVNTSPPSNYSNGNYENHPVVVLRQKKSGTVRSQKEESRLRHPMPTPTQFTAPRQSPPQVTTNGNNAATNNRFRPISTNSYQSIASSGMENVVWRNSQISTSTVDSSRRNTLCEAEAAPRVAKLEGILSEEEELVRRGLETAKKLLVWYEERLESLEKRQRLLSKGMVNLDTAVHEQKLNFLRAHVVELNRRAVALMETSDRGFPTHANLQRAQLPQPHDDQLLWLHRQNRQLNQELGEKSKIIEELTRERDLFEKANSVTRIQPMRKSSSGVRPSAFVRPAQQQPPSPFHSNSPVKVYDTLM